MTITKNNTFKCKYCGSENGEFNTATGNHPACERLTKENDALRLRCAALEAALKPFAEFGILYLPVDETDKTSPWVLADDEHVIPAGHLDAPRVGEFRKAAIALQPDTQRDANG